MLKKVTILLLTVALMMQLVSPVANASADELYDADYDYDVNPDESEVEIDAEIVEVDGELNEPEMYVEGIIDEEIDEELEEESDTGQNLEQASIDAMYAFIASNSAENPFVIPRGLTFNEALNALDWGEGVTVLTPGNMEEDVAFGAIALILNEQSDGIPDDEYWFFDTAIVVQHEEPTTTRPTLTQASIDAMYDFLVNNSEKNPFIIPRGSSLTEALNALNWGEDVTVRLVGHLVDGCETTGPVTFEPNSSLCESDVELFLGSVALHLNLQTIEGEGNTFDDEYWIGPGDIFFQYEDSTTTRPTLPQTGTDISLNMMLSGSALAALGGVIAYRKIKND